MQIISFEYSRIFMKTLEIREKTQEKWGIQLVYKRFGSYTTQVLIARVY